MKVKLSYHGQSGLVSGASGGRILQMAPNLARDAVAFDARLLTPLRFREAISALHDVVINDLRFEPRDKAAYEQWKAQQLQRERQIRAQAREQKRKELSERTQKGPPKDLKTKYDNAKKRYWRSRRELNVRLRKENHELWRKLMPYDPVITIADDVVFFECFSRDESSYGCLSVNRSDCFEHTENAQRGTTNVDYSWDLYESFQKLRTYRETRFNIDPTGFEVATADSEVYREEKIELPDGWLRGFMQLQAAMCLPMRRVRLSVGCVYSLLAFLKRNKAKKSPRAIRFELNDGQAPRLVLEPWEKEIVSEGTVYHGPSDQIRIWGRRRLLTLSRLLPLCDDFDVYLLGTGLPAFWVARMGNMRLTLGLSGWTTNDWTRGSAVDMILPHVKPNDWLVANVAESLSERRTGTIDDLTSVSTGSAAEVASALNQLALRGQVIHDLDANVFRWRQVLPMALSDKEIGPPHPELGGAFQLLAKKKYKISGKEPGPRGGTLVKGTVENQTCEAIIDGDGTVRKGSCKCSWHHKFGIRNGPCRHLQVLREIHWSGERTSGGDWYTDRLKWAGR